MFLTLLLSSVSSIDYGALHPEHLFSQCAKELDLSSLVADPKWLFIFRSEDIIHLMAALLPMMTSSELVKVKISPTFLEF